MLAPPCSRLSAGARPGDPQLSTRLGIAVPLKAPDERGFPHGSEFGELDAIEERIVGALRATGGGRLVLVITTAGMREFVSYVRSPAAGEAAVAQVRSSTATHEVQHYTEPDAEWTVLKECRTSMRGASAGSPNKPLERPRLARRSAPIR